MKIDTLFVLSAGHGTRMGPLGKSLPKPLWPVFERTLLELQFELYRNYQIPHKVINTHHQAQMIERFVKKCGLDLHTLHEPTLLGIGGAICNLNRTHSPQGTILLVNSDQLLYIDPETLQTALQQATTVDVTLFALSTQRQQGYHQLQVSPDQRLLGIETHPQSQHYLTYSGVALINSKAVPKTCMRGKFFHSIAHPTQRRVKVMEIKNPHALDFGTLPRYLAATKELMQQLKANTPSPLTDLLHHSGAIVPARLNLGRNSYHSPQPHQYNFGHLIIDHDQRVRLGPDLFHQLDAVHGTETDA